MEKATKEKYSYGYALEINKPFKANEEQFNYKLKNGKMESIILFVLTGKR